LAALGAKPYSVCAKGAKENTAVVSALLGELMERGVDFSVPFIGG